MALFTRFGFEGVALIEWFALDVVIISIPVFLDIDTAVKIVRCRIGI
ncbi:hypothetical protein [Polaromonas sp. C04]|nr:hypothetical protein [Polaromonas sp. C04]